jgi:type 1 fimbria pilin
MKRLVPAVLASVLTSSVWAASTTDLNVRGRITPSSCNPTLSGGGAVDLGKISAAELKPDQHTALPTRSMSLSVRCEGSTFFAMNMIDNRSGTSFVESLHGLGMTSTNQKVGAVAFGLSNAVADSAPVRPIFSTNGGATWVPASYVGHAALTSVAAIGGADTPLALQNLDADLRVYSNIAPADGLTLIDQESIDGHVTLQLKYL